MKIYIVHKNDTIYGVFSNKIDALVLELETIKNLGLEGYMDTKVYLTEKEIK